MNMFKALINSVTGKGFGRLFSGSASLGGDYIDRQQFQQTGFTSIPPSGSQGIIVKEGKNYICIATADNPDNVPELQNEGDVAIYTSSDYLIKISASGNIEIKGNGTPGSIVLGAGVADNIMKDSIITKFNTHGHLETGTAGGISSTPIIGGAQSPPSTVTFLATDATSEVKAS